MGQTTSAPSSKQTVSKPVASKTEVSVEYDYTPIRFSVQNIEEVQRGVEHLNEYGYAVFSNVLSNEEVNKSVDLFWAYLEHLKHPYHIRRDYPATWDEPWPGASYIGLVNKFGIGQSQFMWSVRGNPNVKKVFSQIWDSNELAVSFDGAGCFRNWHLNEEWKTAGGWYHCDQNPFRKPDRCCIQGLVSLTDSDESTGGLVVVPNSHKHFLELKSTTDERRTWGDLVRVPWAYPLLEQLPPRLIKCKAGDLIVWDSRCIHCNTPALVEKPNEKGTELLRLAAYICMSPVSMFAPVVDVCQNIDEFRQLREQHVRDRVTCTHWPLELVVASDGVYADKEPLRLNGFQRSLIVGTHVEPENGTDEVEF